MPSNARFSIRTIQLLSLDNTTYNHIMREIIPAEAEERAEEEEEEEEVREERALRMALLLLLPVAVVVEEEGGVLQW